MDDADGDGTPELYAADWEGAVHSLTALGRLRWTVRTDAPITGYNGLAIADLDRDGTKEIVVGALDGTVLCLTPAGRILWQFYRRGSIGGAQRDRHHCGREAGVRQMPSLGGPEDFRAGAPPFRGS